MNIALKGVFPWWPFSDRPHLGDEAPRGPTAPRRTRTIEEKYEGMHSGAGPAVDIYDIVRDMDRRISDLEARDK